MDQIIWVIYNDWCYDGVVAKTRSVASERTLHGQLLSLGLWMRTAGEKRRCEAAEDAGGVKEMGIGIERFGDEHLLRISSETALSLFHGMRRTVAEIGTELSAVAVAERPTSGNAAVDCGLVQTCLEAELH